MAKKVSKKGVRKFAVGGIDPEKPVQPFPAYYSENEQAFNAADQQARSYMTDWFSKRAQAFPEHAPAANAMGEYLQKSGQGVYVPEETKFSGVNTTDALGFANEPDYRMTLDQSANTALLNDNPFAIPQSGGKIKGNATPLRYNTAYYIGEGGKQPTTQLEEQLHLASNYGEYMSPRHAKSFKTASDYINPGNIAKMGYMGMQGDEKYFGDTQEFYPRLMSARRTFGLDPSKKYTQQEMTQFLNKGYNDIINNNFTEPGQREHLIEFYKQLGYPTPQAGFSQGASQEEIEKAKQEAAEKFRKANDEFAMNRGEEEGILRARTGGMSKNMLNANSTTGPRSSQSWQDPGVNETSGNTNGVRASYYFSQGGLKTQVTKKFRAAGFETDPPPTNPPVDEDVKMRQDYANQMAALEAQNATYAKRLADEQARVKRVRGNVIPAAYALDKADDNLSNEALNAFDRSRMAETPQELKEAIKNYPAELRNVLPNGGNYNIAKWDAANNSWKSGSGPDRELYCTPYGCFTYQKAGATDVPIVGGNYGFVGGVKKGELPFKEISDKEAQAGDIAIVYGEAPASYTEGGRFVVRPHHTTVLSDKNPIVRDDNGNIQGINMFNADNGNRLFYDQAYYPKEDHFGFYRYVGQLPKLEAEGASYLKRKQAIEDEYNRRHAAWLAQQPADEPMAMKEAGPIPMQGMPEITTQLQNSDFSRYLEQNKPVEKVRRIRFRV